MYSISPPAALHTPTRFLVFVVSDGYQHTLTALIAMVLLVLVFVFVVLVVVVVAVAAPAVAVLIEMGMVWWASRGRFS
jgi:Flp pilus assembly protein TadB